MHLTINASDWFDNWYSRRAAVNIRNIYHAIIKSKIINCTSFYEPLQLLSFGFIFQDIPVNKNISKNINNQDIGQISWVNVSI